MRRAFVKHRYDIGSVLICLQCVAFVMMHVPLLSYQPSLLLSMALSYQTSAFEVARAYLLSTITPAQADTRPSSCAENTGGVSLQLTPDQLGLPSVELVIQF